MPRELLDPGEVLAGAVGELHSLAGMRGIRLKFAAYGKASLVRANQAALRRIFLVLLDNALKYSSEGAEVEAAIAAENGVTVASVKDAGPGIRAEDLPHIFKRFYQADRARTDGGFGLGLSLAESIARAHGARIEVISSEGAGSTFRVIFAEATNALRGTPAAQTPDRWSNEPPLRTGEAVPSQAELPGTGSA
jgi:signal transduction histidine kinase